MKKEWIKTVSEIMDSLDNTNQIKCPNCRKSGIEYIYVGDEKTRVGYLQIWCNKCLKGTYVSRTVAPQDAKFITFNDNVKNFVPEYEII